MFMYSFNMYSRMKTAVALDSFIFADIEEVYPVDKIDTKIFGREYIYVSGRSNRFKIFRTIIRHKLCINQKGVLICSYLR